MRPDEIDVAELYDAFTYMTLVTLEDLGFCAKGEGGQFVEKGRLTVGGELPVNTDGVDSRPSIRGCGACSSWWRQCGNCAGRPGTPGQEDGRTPSRAGGGLRDGRVVLLVGDGGAGTVGPVVLGPSAPSGLGR